MTLDYLVRTYGYLGLFLGAFFEGETVLILGGLTAHLGLNKRVPHAFGRSKVLLDRIENFRQVAPRIGMGIKSI